MLNAKRLILNWFAYIDRSNSARQFWVIFIHISIFVASALSAFFVRFEFDIPHDELIHLYTATILWIPIKLVIFHIADLNRGSWRFVSVYDIRRLAIANTVASAIGFAGISFFTSGFPRSIYAMDLL